MTTTTRRTAAALRTVREIDALIDALKTLRHYTALQADAGEDHDDRRWVAAANLAEEAHTECLLSAYDLFEVEALHTAWHEA